MLFRKIHYIIEFYGSEYFDSFLVLEKVLTRILVISIVSAFLEYEKNYKTYYKSAMTGKSLHYQSLISILLEKSEVLIQNPEEILNGQA